MTIEELHRTVVDGFQRVEERLAGHDKQFAGIDERFAGIDGRFAGIDERFARIDERFDRMDERFDRMDERFAGIDERLDRMEARFEARFELVDARIREEGETTRRHFNVMVERVEALVKVVAESHGHLQTVVDNHEARLQSIEKRAFE